MDVNKKRLKCALSTFSLYHCKSGQPAVHLSFPVLFRKSLSATLSNFQRNCSESPVNPLKVCTHSRNNLGIFWAPHRHTNLIIYHHGKIWTHCPDMRKGKKIFFCRLISAFNNISKSAVCAQGGSEQHWSRIHPMGFSFNDTAFKTSCIPCQWLGMETWFLFCPQAACPAMTQST